MRYPECPGVGQRYDSLRVGSLGSEPGDPPEPDLGGLKNGSVGDYSACLVGDGNFVTKQADIRNSDSQ